MIIRLFRYEVKMELYIF